MRSLCRLLLLLGGAAACLPAVPTTDFYNNLSATIGRHDVVGQLGPLYNSFSTGSTATTLTDVKLMLLEINAPQGSFTVALYANATGNVPGAQIQVLGTLTDTTVSQPDGDAVYDFPVNPGIALTANTRYWIGMTTTNNSQSEWAATLSTTGTGNIPAEYNCQRQQVVGSAIRAHLTGQLTCNLNTVDPYLMQVTATPVVAPPPTVPTLSPWAMLALTGLIVGSAALLARLSPRVLA